MDERSQDVSEHDVKRIPGRKNGGKKHTGSKKSKNEGGGPGNEGGNVKSKKQHKKNKEQVAKPPAQHKLVVRLLPPNLTDKQFFDAVDIEIGSKSGPEAGSEFLTQNVESRYYVQGHFSRKPFKLPTYSRAYLTFHEPGKLQEFARKIGNLRFTDDNDNSMIPTIAMSPYVKKLRVEDSKGVRNTKTLLEGTIEKDKTFQTFIKSLALLKENRQEYEYADLSVIQPLQKALDLKREEEARIKNQGERAIVALAGEVNKEKTKKKKNKLNNKKKASDTVEPKKKSKKPTSQGGGQDKQNMVIIEAAGRRELQRRERIKKMVEKESKTGSVEITSAAEKSNASKNKNKSAKKPRSKKRPNSKGKKKDGNNEANETTSRGNESGGGKTSSAKSKHKDDEKR
ncbi:LANO_0A04082g1_1 [Lachancea nothofagi CBS 11611]|uniref:LANO_0A04082g1_1 n=1 Tax=Lachancea nothofagi CBS 11611 TaxID=1266666 RepID=A0A1G4IQ55_9SACH|nr:LANO_0A04082g1_1 [Lachancea nothofagi CBS 11611]